MSEAIRFTVESTCARARAGALTAPRGQALTPLFMPVATGAAIKGMTPAQLRQSGAQVLLGNTYHLALRPGETLVRDFGGLSAFMGWHGPMLTDSGGFQVYSLAAIRRLDDEGVRFRSHIDGAEFFLTPERAVAIQQDLGADMIMALDECPPADSDRDTVAGSLKRTHAWAARCREAWTARSAQALFGIVQGGIHEDLRRESAEAIRALNLPGNAIGGVSVGEAPEDVARIVDFTAALLPPEKPRYLMGVGRPQDMLRAVAAGVDMFDCVMPTRHARHAQVFTASGRLNLRNHRFREDRTPIESDCDCYTCATVGRGYLRHLFQAGEIMAPVYASIHNVRYYLRLMQRARAAILDGTYQVFMRESLARIESGEG